VALKAKELEFEEAVAALAAAEDSIDDLDHAAKIHQAALDAASLAAEIATAAALEAITVSEE